MKQLVVLVGYAIFLLGLASCQDNSKNVGVVTEEGGPFPDFLVGAWKAQGDK